jgi:ChaB
LPKSSRYGLRLAGELPGSLKRSSKESQDAFARMLASAAEAHREGDQAVRAAFVEFKRAFEKCGDHWIPKLPPSPEG